MVFLLLWCLSNPLCLFQILKILKDKIVVGHAIHHDFQALKYFHPKDRTRDTSQSPVLKKRAGLPVRANVSLKNLARHLLHKKIQVSTMNPEMRNSPGLSMNLCGQLRPPTSMCVLCEVEMNLIHPVLLERNMLGEERTSQADH